MQINFTTRNILYFFKRRFLRIYPLLIAVTIITVILNWHKNYSFEDIFLNITGLFAVFKVGSHIAGGSWTLGNEIIYYMAFPLLIYLKQKNTYLFNLTYLCSFILLLFFAFDIIKDSQPLGIQKQYLNPINHIFFFISGIFVVSKQNVISKQKLILYALLILIPTIVIVKYGNEPIYYMSGIRRIYLSLSVVAIASLLLHFSINQISPFLGKIFSFLGEISYSIYLLHPIVLTVIAKVNRPTIKIESLYILYFLSIISTLIVAYFSHKYFESYFYKRKIN